MFGQNKTKLLPSLVALAMAAGCGNPADKKTIAPAQPATNAKTPGNGPLTDSANGTGTPAGGGSVDLDLEGKSILTATYAVNVKVIGMNFCQGTLTIDLHVPKQSVPGERPASPFDVRCLNIQCSLVGTIQIDSLFGMLSQSAVDQQTQNMGGQSPLSIDDKFIRFTQSPIGKFTPAMVLLPNFTGGDPEFLRTMNVTQAVTATDDSKGVSSPGSQHVQTLQYNSTFAEVPYKGITFDKIFHFTVDNTGFENIPRIEAMMFDNIEAWINLAPLSLVKLHISTKAGDIMQLMNGAQPTTPPPVNGNTCANVQAGSSILSGGLLGGGAAGGGAAGGGGLFGGLLGGLLGGGGGGAAGGGLASGSVMMSAVKLIAGALSVEGEAVLVDQVGLKEAYDRVKANSDSGEKIGLRDFDATDAAPAKSPEESH